MPVRASRDSRRHCVIIVTVAVTQIILSAQNLKAERRQDCLHHRTPGLFGVKEYWLGDPTNKALEILGLKGDKYELHCCAEEKGKLASPLLGL